MQPRALCQGPPMLRALFPLLLLAACGAKDTVWHQPGAQVSRAATSLAQCTAQARQAYPTRVVTRRGPGGLNVGINQCSGPLCIGISAPVIAGPRQVVDGNHAPRAAHRDACMQAAGFSQARVAPCPAGVTLRPLQRHPAQIDRAVCTAQERLFEAP